MFFKLTITLAVLLANTCNRQALEEETLLIREQKAPCMGVTPMLCLQVKHEQDSSWTLLSSEIEGFNYEPGFRYKLKVKVVPVKNPPADGSSLRYVLEKVEEKSAVAE